MFSKNGFASSGDFASRSSAHHSSQNAGFASF
jgi:hypothetical protein